MMINVMWPKLTNEQISAINADIARNEEIARKEIRAEKIREKADADKARYAEMIKRAREALDI